MSQGPTQLTRFFVRPQYSISYQKLRRLDRITEGRSDYEVLFLLAGQLIYELEDHTGDLQPREALLFNPATTVRLKARNVESLLLTLAPGLILEYAANAHLVSATSTVSFEINTIVRDDRLCQMAMDLAGELVQNEPGQDIVIAALVEQMVVHLLRRYSRMRRSSELELSRVGLIDRRIRRAVEFMHAQLDQELSLNAIAAASYLSPFHFSRLFKKVTGTTPHAYHARLRMTRAQSLLAETDLSIGEIGSSVGYSSPSHFTKAFRQFTGLSPRSFRRALVGR
jgi:AraC-like DNA-binding protein